MSFEGNCFNACGNSKNTSCARVDINNYKSITH